MQRLKNMQINKLCLYLFCIFINKTFIIIYCIQAIIEESIDAVRDLEETEFAAEPRDAEAALLEFIGNVRDLQPTDFSKVFDENK